MSSGSFILSAVIVALIAMGAVLMSMAIFKTQRVSAMLSQEGSHGSNPTGTPEIEPQSNNQIDPQTSTQISTLRSWQLLTTFMWLFLGGYSLAVYIIADQQIHWLPLLTGTVFFGGALFVLLSVSLYRQTLQQLLVVQANYREERNRANNALSQLQQTQMLMIHHEKMLGLGQLSAGVAHEINNPINFIHGNLIHLESHVKDMCVLLNGYEQIDTQQRPKMQALRDELDVEFIKEDAFKILTSMKTGTQRIRDIVTAMTGFSRLQESKLKQADVTQGLEDTLTILQNRLRHEQNGLTIDIARRYEKVPAINGDHCALNQVFLSLLNNAIDALEEKAQEAKAQNTRVQEEKRPEHFQPKITLSIQPGAESWVRIAIADNGSGMPKSVAQQIFNPFFTTKPIGKGTGLGLSMSYKIIVDQHKGKISCESVEGEGTTFTLDLPIQTAPSGSPNPAKPCHSFSGTIR